MNTQCYTNADNEGNGDDDHRHNHIAHTILQNIYTCTRIHTYTHIHIHAQILRAVAKKIDNVLNGFHFTQYYCYFFCHPSKLEFVSRIMKLYYHHHIQCICMDVGCLWWMFSSATELTLSRQTNRHLNKFVIRVMIITIINNIEAKKTGGPNSPVIKFSILSISLRVFFSTPTKS